MGTEEKTCLSSWRVSVSVVTAADGRSFFRRSLIVILVIRFRIIGRLWAKYDNPGGDVWEWNGIQSH